MTNRPGADTMVSHPDNRKVSQMLQRGKDTSTYIHGFLVGVEMEEGAPTSAEQVALRLADACSFMEGIGKIDVESLGKLDIYPESEEDL